MLYAPVFLQDYDKRPGLYLIKMCPVYQQIRVHKKLIYIPEISPVFLGYRSQAEPALTKKPF